MVQAFRGLSEDMPWAQKDHRGEREREIDDGTGFQGPGEDVPWGSEERERERERERECMCGLTISLGIE